MEHGVFWYGKLQKMNMNGLLADTTTVSYTHLTLPTTERV